MSYKYKYENEKEKLHSEEGLRVITYTLRIVHDLLEEAGQ